MEEEDGQEGQDEDKSIILNKVFKDDITKFVHNINAKCHKYATKKWDCSNEGPCDLIDDSALDFMVDDVMEFLKTFITQANNRAIRKDSKKTHILPQDLFYVVQNDPQYYQKLVINYYDFQYNDEVNRPEKETKKFDQNN
ncbi:hypothetical protein PPERSA_11703 [Pseudocohnilembus persalinus]|uniref:Histone-fold n=1 Tax=Pseudocohnilembus persalinus TaxID=266149 RepID=A0A0V0R6S1_PSEPJ|nr:hypothetical protein PPERSA_11703 [Pseudocohnilembus persalinus]|eukprot:KRX10205.1 hypothetical protein PPERSA_11703 [Pseudocohnilembus persalinus]